MTVDEALVRVQCAYPKIYLACHERHQNSKTSASKLSQRDSSILSHLDGERAVQQGEFARHLGVAKSTLSEAIDGLVLNGFVSREKQGRAMLLRRTPAGTKAMSQSSVLEPVRLRKLLRRLSPGALKQAVAGLEVLAEGESR